MWIDDLQRRLVGGSKTGSQRLMPFHQSTERSLKCAHVDDAFNPGNRANVVEWTVWLQLVEEPKPLLGKRKRERSSY
jgi:hypothetical protein